VVCDETEHHVQYIGTKIFALLGCYTALSQVSGRRVRPIFKGQAGGLLDPRRWNRLYRNVGNYQSTLRNIPEERRLLHCGRRQITHCSISGGRLPYQATRKIYGNHPFVFITKQTTLTQSNKRKVYFNSGG
jgi:hypothetical protein